MSGRILVIRGGAIGDFILTLPGIRLLRENFPDCHLEILGYRHIAVLAEGRFYADATRSIEYAPMAGFFNPRADLDAGLCAYFRSFQQIISYVYDPDNLFESCLRRAGVKNLLAASPKVSDGDHAARQLARPLEKLALWLDDSAARFFPSKDDQEQADRILSGIAAPIIALHPGSGGERKNWPIARWRRLLEKLYLENPRAQFLVIGGESDTGRLTTLRNPPFDGQCTFLENLSLPVLGAVLSKCRFFLGHDSGISHLAAAAGARCLLLFGPTDPAVWAPANKGTQVLVAPQGRLSDLETDVVFRKLNQMLKDVKDVKDGRDIKDVNRVANVG